MKHYARALTALLALFAILSTVAQPAFAAGGPIITGRVIDVQGGLPIANATVRLNRNTTQVATTATAADGSFAFPAQPQGVYTVQVTAREYQTTNSDDIFVLANEASVNVQLAIQRATSSNLKTIASVRVSGNAALQTSATINQHIDPVVLQSQDFIRAGDALATLPFVNGSTSSSLGDDLGISIRGFKSSEAATLLDGHPIGPIGAFGQGYDFQLSPFWGLSNMNVVYGSGATGLYGVPTMAGSIDFQTIVPTRERHFTFEQGVGNMGHTMTALSATGTTGRLGYAAAYGVEGTEGELVGNPLQSNLLLDPSQCNANSPDAGFASVKRADILACSYPVDGAYVLRNAVAKLTYDFSSRTQLALTAYNETMWANSSGNGDTDFVTYQANQYNNAPPSGTTSETLPNGTNASCTNSFIVLNDSAAGYECMGLQQYNQTFAGPAGGGLGRYHDGRLQDYHGRVRQQLGSTNLILDAYVDNYGYDNIKGDYPHHHFTDIYRTHGYLISDDFLAGRSNIVTVGAFAEHQQHVGTDANDLGVQGLVKPDLQVSAMNYFARDVFTPTSRFNVFLDLNAQKFTNTPSTYFDPRLSFVFHPTTNDVVRITGGRATSIPDPSQTTGGFSFLDVNSWNIFSCSAPLVNAGSGASPNLQPESSDDLELAYGHRFNAQTTIQANLYDSHETNALVAGVFPIGIVPAADLPANLYVSSDPSDPSATYQGKLAAKCPSLGVNNIGVSTLFNAASATYRGIDLDATVGIVRNLKMNAEYAVQSAFYQGIPDYLLQQNVTLVNGSQFYGIPLHRANLGFDYSTPGGFDAQIDGYYVGYPNGFNSPPYRYANLSVSQSFPQGVIVNVGVNNVFNSYASQYGLIGLGSFQQENQYGSDANGLQQGSELFGLPYRQIWVTITRKI